MKNSIYTGATLIAILFACPSYAQHSQQYDSDRDSQHRVYSSHHGASNNAHSRKHYRRITGRKVKARHRKSRANKHHFNDHKTKYYSYHDGRPSQRSFYISYGGFNSFYGLNYSRYLPLRHGRQYHRNSYYSDNRYRSRHGHHLNNHDARHVRRMVKSGKATHYSRHR
jgi:hypothetical protein